MKISNLIIRIPEPCHEDWNAMQPDAKGKFCGSCNKAVFDFSNKTDNEIKDILVEYKDQKVCGHFKKTQIDRPLNISFNLNNLPKNISATKAFAIALFLVFGTFLFSCTNPQGKRVDGIEVTNSGSYTLGLLAIPDTIAFETLMGDTISTLEESCVTTTGFVEQSIQGGLVYEEPIDTLFAPKDSVLPIIEEMHMVGQMVAYEVFEPNADTTAIDSVFIKDNDRKINDANTTKQNNLLIYPNPNNGEFNIKYSVIKRADIKIDIYNLNGALIKNVVNQPMQFEGNYQIPVNLADLPNGIYLVALLNNGNRFTERVVIAK